MTTAFSIRVARNSGRWQAAERQGDRETSVFERVRSEVDLHKVLPPSGAYKEFDGYYLAHCINPEHPDTQLSLLVFHDGVKCQACGLKADTTDVYLMFHPELSKFEAAVALLSGNYRIDGDAKAKPKVLRSLDPDQALKYHLALAGHPDRVEQLEKVFGFERRAIQHFRLGWARVLVPIMPDEYHLVETAPDIEWRQKEGRDPEPYQWQWRFSVPVFDGGRDSLRQMLYRKANDTDLGKKIQMEYRAGTSWLFNGNALDDAEYVVFSSGWGDAIVQWQWGIPAVSGISGDGQFRGEWIPRLKQIRRLYSATDADTAGLKLRERLSAEIPWIRHITLPYPIGTKKDVRDYHLDGHGGDEYKRLMKRADMEASWRTLRRVK